MEATSNSPAINGDVLSVTVTIVNDLGLHARPAAEFVKIANRYKDSQIVIKCEDLEVNGKSIMGLLMLAAGRGTQLTLTATGPSRAELVGELTALIEAGFGEEISDP